METPLIERFARSFGRWLEHRGYWFTAWAANRRYERERAARDAKFGAWEDIGEAAEIPQTGGYSFVSCRPVQVGPGDEVGFVVSSVGIQTRIRRPVT